MNYTETVDWLYNQLPVYQRDGFIKYKLDLNSIKSVCNFLQNPQGLSSFFLENPHKRGRSPCLCPLLLSSNPQ